MLIFQNPYKFYELFIYDFDKKKFEIFKNVQKEFCTCFFFQEDSISHLN